ncbi:MAG: AAA family ATPase [Candidatus Competibacteraceae bacterium]|nr:AAA family ATPase [Candidatus Competibacteraceae bacterium]
MFITQVKLKNWRNFKEVDIPLRDQTYLIGPNASGKSNLLDVFRFLRDVSKSAGGGLQKAVEERGGISKLRCLHARRDPEVRIEVHISELPDSESPKWHYILGFKLEGKGAQRLLVSKEQVWLRDAKKPIINRPNREDKSDPRRLTETYLEQVNSNGEFREIVDFFSAITYLHLVPQLLKYGDKIGGNRLEDDPFGQGFLERIARCPQKTRDSRLKKIENTLKAAVPRLEQLKFEKDKITGHPHLEARYEHHRPNAGWQREEQFSDGTLRLLGLLWSLLDGDSLLLLEEPELSLNDAIIEQIPRMIQSLQRKAKRRRQIMISTHSEALLRNPAIDGRGVLRLDPGDEGTKVRVADSKDLAYLEAGLSVAEVLLPKVRPKGAEQLELF